MRSRIRRIFVTSLLAALAAVSVGAQEGADPSELREALELRNPNNPRIAIPTRDKAQPAPHGRKAARFPDEFRTIDGTGNNGAHPSWGSAGIPFLRKTTVDYGDGASTPSGVGLASAREISNLVVAQAGSTPNADGVSDMVWQWGQFLDHDIDLTPFADPVEHFDVAVPTGDPHFDPAGTGTQEIPVERSVYQTVAGVRQQLNTITAFVDGSNVYGSDAVRAQALRTLDGTGRLATSAGDLLPFNTAGLPNAAPGGADPADFFLAGDFRANEQVGLTAMHTLFVREHNYWADSIGAEFPELSGDEVYHIARAIVGAEMQAITYNEFLPILLGKHALDKYRGYKPGVDPSISNVFATAAYRFGHSMLSPQLQRLDADGEEIPAGHLSLAQAFFNPAAIIDEGIDPLLRGLLTQPAQEIDAQIVDEVRNFLFGPPGAGGFDLASLNIQRGRDHGLPGYNQVRADFGLPPATSFADVTSDPALQAALASAYATVDDVDVWVGGLAEDHLPGALVGETVFTILKDQFQRLRDGDRFWYESYLPKKLAKTIRKQSLADVIQRNADVDSKLAKKPFLAAE